MAIEAAASPPPPSPSEAAASRARQGGGEGEEGESMREEKKVWEMFISPLFRFFFGEEEKRGVFTLLSFTRTRHLLSFILEAGAHCLSLEPHARLERPAGDSFSLKRDEREK